MSHPLRDIRDLGLARFEPYDAFAELGKIMLGSQPLTAILERVAELAKQTLPGADDVSVTLLDGDTVGTVVFTGNLAAGLDERQYESGFGPCLDAAASGATVRIDDTAHEDTYTDFAAMAFRFGVRSTLSVGLPVPQQTIGALNVYVGSDEPMDREAEAIAQTFAGYAAVALANATLYSSTADLAAQMQQAMQSRAVIEQAKGVIMAERRCSPDEAFTLLVRWSQDRNCKLRDLAEEIVARVGQAGQRRPGGSDGSGRAPGTSRPPRPGAGA
jgi:GAF domain-containing protein